MMTTDDANASGTPNAKESLLAYFLWLCAAVLILGIAAAVAPEMAFHLLLFGCIVLSFPARLILNARGCARCREGAGCPTPAWTVAVVAATGGAMAVSLARGGLLLGGLVCSLTPIGIAVVAVRVQGRSR